MNLMKRIFLVTIVTFVYSSSIFSRVEVVLSKTGQDLSNNPNLIGREIPNLNSDEIILSRDQYIISYNKITRLPNWSMWKLENNQIGTSGRSNEFSIDIELEDYLAVSRTHHHAVNSTEYKDSCFDRGHQVPSADRTDTIENNRTTFYMSNMIPQTPFLNRIIWERLEQHTRNIVKNQNKKAYIIAGPVYSLDYGYIGPRKDIKVPSHDFKIIFILNPNEDSRNISSKTPYIAVVMPNTLEDGSNPTISKNELCKKFTTSNIDPDIWKKYLSDISSIEKLSGLKFKF